MAVPVRELELKKGDRIMQRKIALAFFLALGCSSPSAYAATGIVTVTSHRGTVTVTCPVTSHSAVVLAVTRFAVNGAGVNKGVARGNSDDVTRVGHTFHFTLDGHGDN